jgi:2-deoxy-scyllo-inosamine dehydrogenase (SAM-dependent)/8-amino-3,8-dideoxy-alpha-D-manno-octulosonate transaminase
MKPAVHSMSEPRLSEGGRLPLFERLEIESHSHCNRSCWFCPRTHDRSGTYLDAEARPIVRRLESATILDLLDQATALGFRGTVAFHILSEPLLDERNLDFARAARNRGMRPRLVTNGDLLRRDEALCAEVQSVYNDIVVGLYDYGSVDELEAEEHFWRQRLSHTALEFSRIGRDGARSGPSMAIPRALVPPDARIAIPDLTFDNAPCHRPLIRMMIRYDGEVMNCCEDVHGAFSLGNVHQSTLEELWFGERHAEVVRLLDAGQRSRFDLCRRCPLAPTGPAPVGSRLEMRRRSATS